ncbi:MAG: hypothetical protein H8E82_02515 [Candidatus Marinimicrobia bacterium]|nr:hypothetical protein [Candidatus Neomarinimicrobiota bacterium]
MRLIRNRRKILIVVLGLVFLSCDLPFVPKPSNDDTIFTLNHDYDGKRVVDNIPITLSWSEITIDNFQKFTIFRSIKKNGEENWEQRNVIYNPLTTSYIDTLDDDGKIRYRIRMEDVDGNFRNAETDQIIIQTTYVIVPEEYGSLQNAHNTPFVDNGDTIFVLPGGYMGPFVFEGKNVFILSEEGPSETILRKPNGNIVTINRGQLDGFTITDGNGLMLYGTSIMTNCIINGIRATGVTGGIIVTDTAEVYYCTFSENNTVNLFGEGLNGGGLIVSGNAIVRNCRFEQNCSSLFGGGIAIYDEPTITNCIIGKNVATEGGGGLYIGLYSNPIIRNCVIFKNTSGLPYGKFGSIYIYKSSFHLENSIIWANSSYGSNSMIWRNTLYCDTDEGLGTSGTGNISDAPKFVDANAGDFHLQSNSPCIDAGNPGESYNDVDGTRNDIGAYGGPYGDW